jgi:hypothetical protein
VAEAVEAGTAIAIATSQATSVASAIANAVATATAGIAIGLGYAGGQAVKEATGAIRDMSRGVIDLLLGMVREYFRLINEKPEVGLTGTILALYLLAG